MPRELSRSLEKGSLEKWAFAWDSTAGAGSPHRAQCVNARALKMALLSLKPGSSSWQRSPLTPNVSISTSPRVASCICTLWMVKLRSTYTAVSPEPALKRSVNKHLPLSHLPFFLQHFQSYRPAETIISSGLTPAII